jgi:hypothetical protein
METLPMQTVDQLKAGSHKVYVQRGHGAELYHKLWLNRASTVHVSCARGHLFEMAGREVSTSLIMRRALEVYVNHLAEVRAAGSDDAELAALIRHIPT